MEELGNGSVNIEGVPWTADGRASLGRNALTAKVLCKRHNTALSPLDDAAGYLHRIMHQYHDSLRRGDATEYQFSLFDGETIERWLLKLLWGFAASGVGRFNDQVIRHIAPTLSPSVLTDIIFRGDSLPYEWGMHVSFLDGTAVGAKDSFALNPYMMPSGELHGVGAEFGGVSLRIGIAARTEFQTGRTTLMRPSAIALLGAKSQRIVGFGWRGKHSESLVLRYGGRGGGLHPSS